ncbi:MAG: hypothetical protein C5B44_00675 [Acidobacteria bacterium]|nr:MAG: hypothetical protein C5B44_00675 [Acidobacteriota bacterium]
MQTLINAKFFARLRLHERILRMDPSTFITYLGLSTITSAGISSAIIWLSKEWVSERIKGSIQHEYNEKLESYKGQLNEKLETHKAQLQSAANIQIERLKSELQVMAAERNVRYSRIYDKIADAVIELHKKMLTMSNAAHAYCHPEGLDFFASARASAGQSVDQPDRQQLEKNATQAVWDLFDYFWHNHIYFPQDTSDEISRTIGEIALELAYVKPGAPKHPDEIPLPEKFFGLMRKLESDFRNLIGIVSNTQAATSRDSAESSPGAVPQRLGI